MRLLLLLLHLLPAAAPAQATIVPGALNDTIDLSALTMSVRDLAVIKGRPIPGHADPAEKKPVNLLHWRYFDNFLGRNAIYPTQLLSQPCTQLVDEVPDNEFVSLNITLDAADSLGNQMTFILQLAGVQKWQLGYAPLRGLADADPEAPQRFTAIIRLRPADRDDETYDSLDGQLELTAFDVKKQTAEGRFYIEANRIGKRQRAWFLNGYFH